MTRPGPTTCTVSSAPTGRTGLWVTDITQRRTGRGWVYCAVVLDVYSEAGLMGSMGKVATCYDNALMESFFGSMQIELLDRCVWATRDQLAAAIFEWIEAWYNPYRRHSAIGYRSPVEYETLHTTAPAAA